jgi:hypothetical protein
MIPELFQEWSVMSSASDVSSSPKQQEFLDMMLLIDRSLHAESNSQGVLLWFCQQKASEKLQYTVRWLDYTVWEVLISSS